MDRNRALSWKLAAAMGGIFLLILASLFTCVGRMETAERQQQSGIQARNR